MDSIPLSALLASLLVCLLLSAFFSASETAMMAVNRYRLKNLVQQGHRGAELATQLLSRTDKLLGVLLLGNSLINAASASLATVITFRLIGNDELALGIATITVTFAILVFSEATPKVIAAAYPEQLAVTTSYPLTFLLRIANPIVWFVNLFVNGLLRLMRLHKGNHGEATPLSPEELRILVLEAGNFIDKKHHSILLNLFELQNITVDDVMTPRNQIEAIDIQAPNEQLNEQLATAHHTRLPVYAERIDNILGVIHVRKVLHLSRDAITADSLKSIWREPYFIPSGTPLFTQLQNFQEGQRRQGLVVDEYGELMGLVTIEDILEEIIGEFTSSSPSQRGHAINRDDAGYLVEGATLLRDLNRKLGCSFELDGPKTLNGLILEHFQDIPEDSTCLEINGHRMEIVQTQDRQVRVVKIYFQQKAS